MILARVVGQVVSTVKHASLQGQRLLLVLPLMADRESADGDPIVAIDPTGAAVGQHVMVTSDGPAVRELVRSDTTPARWSVIGIEDETTTRELNRAAR